MVSVDDSRLTELAVEPPERLFPVLDRAAAMAPLVVLMAVLPGLTSLAVVPLERAVVGVEASPPPVADPEIRSPWGRWVAAQPWRDWLSLDGLPANWLPVVPAYLASVALIWMVWHAARGLFGARTGLLAVVAVCCHTPVVMLGRTLEPLALSAVVATATVTGFVAHLQRTNRSLSVCLLVAVLGLATTLLLAAPLACPVVVLLVTAVICHPAGELGVWGNGTAVTRTPVAGRWHGPVSVLLVIGGAAVLVSTWELKVVQSLTNSETLVGISRGLSGWPVPIDRLDWLRTLGWLGGPLLLGIVDVTRDVFGSDRERRPVAVLAMAWAMLVPLAIGLAESGYPLRLAEAFVVIPLAVLVARGVESICDRRVTVGPVVAATCLSGCLGADGLLGRMLGQFIAGAWWQLVVVLMMAIAVGTGVSLSCRDNELYRRRILMGCLVLVLVSQVITGWLQVPIEALDSPALAEN